MNHSTNIQNIWKVKRKKDLPYNMILFLLIVYIISVIHFASKEFIDLITNALLSIYSALTDKNCYEPLFINDFMPSPATILFRL